MGRLSTYSQLTPEADLLPCFRLVCVLVHSFMFGTIKVLCLFCSILLRTLCALIVIAPSSLTFLTRIQIKDVYVEIEIVKDAI